jgi:hypothetical protein
MLLTFKLTKINEIHHKVNPLSGCLKSEIVFNTDALEKIVYEPLWVLANEEEYWTEYPAQKCTQAWAEAVNYEIDYDEWRERITEWSRQSVDERERHIFTRNTRKIVEGRKVFLEKAVPYLCGYLPDDIGLDIGVYFTAFIPPRAFAMGEIVFNVAATYWKNNPDNILNTLVHELYHVGCSNIRERHGIEQPEDPLMNVLSNVQGEGIATYVAYNAQHIFPAPDDKDFEMMDDPVVVDECFRQVKDILSKVGSLPEDELRKLSWDVGVIGRAFYITGADMCRVIDKEKGRESLIETIWRGPRHFFEVYNKLVAAERRLGL